MWPSHLSPFSADVYVVDVLVSLPQNKLSLEYHQSLHLRELWTTKIVSAVWSKLFCSQVFYPDSLKFGVENVTKFDGYFVVLKVACHCMFCENTGFVIWWCSCSCDDLKVSEMQRLCGMVIKIFSHAFWKSNIKVALRWASCTAV